MAGLAHRHVKPRANFPSPPQRFLASSRMCAGLARCGHLADHRHRIRRDEQRVGRREIGVIRIVAAAVPDFGRQTRQPFPQQRDSGCAGTARRRHKSRAAAGAKNRGNCLGYRRETIEAQAINCGSRRRLARRGSAAAIPRAWKAQSGLGEARRGHPVDSRRGSRRSALLGAGRGSGTNNRSNSLRPTRGSWTCAAKVAASAGAADRQRRHRAQPTAADNEVGPRRPQGAGLRDDCTEWREPQLAAAATPREREPRAVFSMKGKPVASARPSAWLAMPGLPSCRTHTTGASLARDSRYRITEAQRGHEPGLGKPGPGQQADRSWGGLSGPRRARALSACRAGLAPLARGRSRLWAERPS